MPRIELYRLYTAQEAFALRQKSHPRHYIRLDGQEHVFLVKFAVDRFYIIVSMIKVFRFFLTVLMYFS